MKIESALDLQLLRAFVAVVRDSGVSRAAQRLNLSQPAVGLQLKRLRELLGVRLFVWEGQGLALAPEGVALPGQAERILDAVSGLAQQAAGMQASARGALRVGTILDPLLARLGLFLGELLESAPQVDP